MTIKNIFIKICFFTTHRISDIVDYVFDMRTCGQNLATKASKTIEEIHSNAPTPYLMLNSIFKHVEISSNDTFLDIGCGNGRVLAFLNKKNSCNQITGIEINQQSFQICKQWTKQHSNITCLNKNVLDISLNGYTLLYLYNPFEKKTLEELIKKIETEVNQPLTLIYASDNEYGKVIVQNSCWHLQNQFYSYRNGLIFFAQYPQRISIWKYTPKKDSPNFFRVTNEDCRLTQSYNEKLKGIKKIDEDHAIYDDGTRSHNVINKETYDEWFKDDQIEPSWDELKF